MYTNNDYRNYLSHHGILGMHWGIRRFQPYGQGYSPKGRGGKEIGEAKKKKTGYIRQAVTQLKRRRQGVRESKNLVDKISYSSLYGFGSKGKASDYTVNKEFETMRAEKSRTKLGKAFHTTNAKNAAEMAKHYTDMSNKSLGERVFRTSVVNTPAFKIPYHRVSGRTTTWGKQALNVLLTGGLAGAALDIKYLHNKKKAAKKQKYYNSDGSMKIGKSDSSVTKRVKSDYNTLSDQEFMNRYSTKKKTYAKRVEKYGDPYTNKSPMYNLAKKQENKRVSKINKKADRIQKDIDSLKPYSKTGIVSNRNFGKMKKGDILVNPDQVNKSISALEERKKKVLSKR